MSYWVSMYDLYGKDTSPLGSGHIFGAPYNLFKTRDSYMYIAIANDQTWEAFCKALLLQDLFADPQFRTSKDRVAQKVSLESLVAVKLENLSTAQVESALLGTGVPFGKFNTVKSLLEDQQFTGRKLLRKFAHQGRDYRGIVNPAVVNGKRAAATRGPPVLGADTERVLSAFLKISPKKLKNLKNRGII
jgi:glutaryl-CoA transferase